ncbi:MAG: phage integrase N-terminal SAM-like domain-containing protein [Thermoplasmatales archaeon]|nr:phage integrase N-terminal SAM-like domain-containing protein [Thermoplasmatales archaeon]
MSDVAEARKENKEILPEQAEIIERYGKYLRGSGIAETTLANKINKISQFALKINKPFNDITREDLENYLDNLYSEISARTERKLKSSTLCIMKSEIKQFFRWLKNSDDYPPIVKWINTGMAIPTVTRCLFISIHPSASLNQCFTTIGTCDIAQTSVLNIIFISFARKRTPTTCLAFNVKHTFCLLKIYNFIMVISVNHA